MSDIIKVEGSDTLVRKLDSKAIVNNSYEDFKVASRIKAEKMRTLDRLNSVEQDVSQIKSMLEKLLVLMDTKGIE